MANRESAFNNGSSFGGPAFTSDAVQVPLTLPDSGLNNPILEEPLPDWLQQMYDLESIGWNGGDEHNDGPHDGFCFICGETVKLFECQTCKYCSHAQCMMPPLDPDKVPAFWFCPHCVERNYHVPPSPATNYLTPNSTSAHIDPSPAASLTTSLEQISKTVNPSTGVNVVGEDGQAKSPDGPVAAVPYANTQHSQASRDTGSAAAKPAAESRPPSDETTSNTMTGRGKPGRTKRSSSPPRKKSKYSSFSVAVDKALSVLYSELETAAECGKSEGTLQSKIQDLEQKLRLQEGQMLLSGRELEAARTNLATERAESGRLRAENDLLQIEATTYREMVQQKDAELKDWRMKLRTMMGSELE